PLRRERAARQARARRAARAPARRREDRSLVPRRRRRHPPRARRRRRVRQAPGGESSSDRRAAARRHRVSKRTDVLLWANRVLALPKTALAHQFLEIPAEANLEAAQEAFHRIARLAHPDLHRNNVTPEDLETISRAYAATANAYQAYRSSLTTVRMKPLRAD